MILMIGILSNHHHHNPHDQVVGPVEPGKCRTNTRLACNNQPRQKCGKTVSFDDKHDVDVEGMTMTMITL